MVEPAPPKKRKKKRRKKKKRRQAEAAAAAAAAEAKKAAAPAETEPEPKAEPEPEPEPEPLPEPEPTASPAEGMVAPLVDPRPIEELAAKTEDRRKGERPVVSPVEPKPISRPATDEDFSLFGATPGFSSPVENDLPSDDWRLPRKRRSSNQVPILAWAVLLLGLIVAAFVVYAVTQSGKGSNSHDQITPVPVVEMVVSVDDLGDDLGGL